MPEVKKNRFQKGAEKFAAATAGMAKTAASFAAKKTKNVSRIAKLNVDIATERDTIKRVYREIGKLYYETHRDDPESYFVQPCQEIDMSMEAIAAMEAEIIRLKTQASPAADSGGGAEEIHPSEEKAPPEDGE